MDDKINIISNSSEIKEAIDVFQKENISGLMKTQGISNYYRPKENKNLIQGYCDLQFELARLIAGWIPTIADFELKMQLGRQAYIFCKIVDVLSERLKELPGNAPIGNDSSLKELRKALSKAPSVEKFLIGIYSIIQRLFLNSLKEHIKNCDPIADLPTIDRLDLAIDIISKQIGWAVSWISTLEDKKNDSYADWELYVNSVFTKFVGVNGVCNEIAPAPLYLFKEKLEVCHEPACLEKGFSVIDEFKFTAERVTQGKLTDILYQNFAEMFVPDSLAYMVYEIEGMPYEFYRDYIKQIWDECRHISMGIRELSKIGISVKDLPINTVKKEKPYTTYLARLCYTGEGCSFPRKLEAAHAFFKHGLSSAAVVTEYDVADESHHVKYAQKWLPQLHQIEECEQPLDSIIKSVQADSLSWVKDQIKDYNKLIKKSDGLNFKFGTFCKTIDFKINFDAI